MFCSQKGMGLCPDTVDITAKIVRIYTYARTLPKFKLIEKSQPHFANGDDTGFVVLEFCIS